MALAAWAAIHPQVSQAEGLTGADFARWAAGGQDSYIQTSVTMAGVVFTRLRPEVSRCIDGWYFAGGAADTRNAALRRLIAENPTYHPSGVIFAAILQACGPIEP